MKIVVIGAGAAGLVAAAEAAMGGAEVLLLEKNSKVGVKILMSGGTRCNLTHHTDARGIANHFAHARRFLQPSLGRFPPAAVVEMFRQWGVETKVEATGKVFPASDRALHVRDALVRRAVDAGVTILTQTTVEQFSSQAGRWQVKTDADSITCDHLIVTSGGQSYPGCGTTGDGYQWLRSCGHKIVPPRPALVPLVGGADWTHELSGLTLEDCVAEVHHASATQSPGKKTLLASRRASWLFTHFGFSGPAAMDVSGTVTAASSFKDVQLFLDLVPDLSADRLRMALSDRSKGGRENVASALSRWLPSRLATAISTSAAGLSADQKLAELSRRSITQLVTHMKQLPLPVNGTRGFAKAEVTAGGVALSEVNPQTMQSRIAPGLYIAGEVLDVDGPIGGYNFQAAFSTGRAAGIAAAQP